MPNQFTFNIWKSIERFSYDVWIVKRIPTVTCTCVNHTTKQPKNDCKKCLGTGTKIKIYKARAVLREAKDQESVFSDTRLSSTPKITYFKYGTFIEKDDYIIDKENIYSPVTKQYLRGENGDPNTIKCVSPAIKMDSSIIIKNFKEVLLKYGYTV